ncbi:MAG: hypothetical protein GF346_01665 [Candidatus Eisenbacteria bacterium]|nr:hypothetical protein [Candidatus Latescibacterota bacterium]MBD3301138.1 hypothetical protein [Candidatus Eisenbacteria bacterium]
MRRPLALPLLCLSGCLALFAVAMIGCSRDESPTGSGPPDDQGDAAGMLEGRTDDRGTAELGGTGGPPLLRVQALDPEGNPLAELDVTFLESDGLDLIAFEDRDREASVGTFALERTDAKRRDPSDDGTAAAIFILDMLDPSRGRLYDPTRDDFVVDVQPTIEEIRQVVGLEMIEAIVGGVPQIRDQGIHRLDAYRTLYGENTEVHLFQALTDDEDPLSDSPVALRLGTLLLASMDQDDAYLYHVYRIDTSLEGLFIIPLGVQPDLQISNPEHGRTYGNPEEAIQDVTGTADCGPGVFAGEGGGLELQVNGAAYRNALTVQHSGNGTFFSSTSPFQLAPGENTFLVSAYVSIANRGLATGDNGFVGQVSVTATLGEGQSSGRPPSLGGLTVPSLFPCPDFSYQVAFDFADPDGDATYFHQYAYLMVDEEPSENRTTVPIAETGILSCLQGTQARCSIPQTYKGLNGGDWLYYEFWVEDATGLESEHLEFYVVVQGDCDP